jgi:hypothetical protein
MKTKTRVKLFKHISNGHYYRFSAKGKSHDSYLEVDSNNVPTLEKRSWSQHLKQQYAIFARGSKNIIEVNY